MTNNNNKRNNNRRNKKQNFDRNAIVELKGAMEEAQTNEQPFRWQNQQGQTEIVGDVAEVDVDGDYIVNFEYPKNFANQFPDAEDNGNGTIAVTRKFDGVSITPRKARRLRHSVSVLITAFAKYESDTGMEIMTVAEIAERYGILTDEVVDAMENVLQVVLGITDVDMEYVTDESLISVTGMIVSRNSGFFQ